MNADMKNDGVQASMKDITTTTTTIEHPRGTRVRLNGPGKVVGSGCGCSRPLLWLLIVACLLLALGYNAAGPVGDEYYYQQQQSQSWW